MSWAEVKKLNSNLNIPLNDLIGTNTRILENELDLSKTAADSSLPYYRIYNLIPILKNSGANMDDYINNKLLTYDNMQGPYPKYYSGYSYSSVDCILYDKQFNKYKICHEPDVCSSSSVLVKGSRNIIYNVDKNETTVLNELILSEITGSSDTTAYIHSGYNSVYRISKYRYIIVSNIAMSKDYNQNNDFANYIRYFKTTISEVIMKDVGFDIKTIEVCSGTANGPAYRGYAYCGALFCSGRHAEIVIPHPYDTGSYYNRKHILLDLEKFEIIKTGSSTSSMTCKGVNNYLQILYNGNMYPIYLDEDKCIKLSGLDTNGDIQRSSPYYNTSYVSDMYYYGYKCLKKGNVSNYRGLFEPLNKISYTIINNKLYSFEIDTSNIESTGFYNSAPDINILEKQLFNNTMYIRCIDTTYDETSGSIVYNITDKNIGNNRIAYVEMVSNSNYPHTCICLDNMYSKIVGDDILVMHSPFTQTNVTSISSLNCYSTFNGKLQTYIIRNFASNNPYIEDLNFDYEEFNVKGDYRNLINNIVGGGGWYDANFGNATGRKPIFYDDLDCIINQYNASSTGGSTVNSTNVTVYPAGTSLSVMKLNKAEDMLKIIKKLLMSSNYIETPLRKNSILMINTSKVVIEGGQYEILNKNRVKILEDEIYKIYYHESVPYMIM